MLVLDTECYCVCSFLFVHDYSVICYLFIMMMRNGTNDEWLMENCFQSQTENKVVYYITHNILFFK